VYSTTRTVFDSLGASGVLRWAMTSTHRRWPETKTYHPEDPFAIQRLPDDKHYLLDRFFTKLLNLHEVMTTASGRAMAQRRTAFLRLYLQEFQRDLQRSRACHVVKRKSLLWNQQRDLWLTRSVGHIVK